MAGIGKQDEALERLQQAQAVIDATSARWDASKVVRQRGELLAELGDHDGAPLALEAIELVQAYSAAV
ncbi:MAG: hypothetical protein ABW003_30140 [Microvirga sp.]